MKRLFSKPSPATVIACIALFVSLGGVSYGVAAGSIDSREIKNSTIRSKDIRNSQVYTQDIRNSTVRGSDVRNESLTGSDVAESSLGKVPSAGSADSAGSAQPVAFAQVDLNGTVVANNSKGVSNANVSHPATGVYCVSGVSFDIKGAAVNTMFTGTKSFAQFTEGTTPNCPNGGQVLTWTDAGVAADQSFHILLYG